MKSLRIVFIGLMIASIGLSVLATQYNCPCDDSDQNNNPPCWQFADIMIVDGQERIVFPIEFNPSWGWLNNSLIFSTLVDSYQIKRNHIIKAHQIIDKDLPLWIDSLKKYSIMRVDWVEMDMKKFIKQYAADLDDSSDCWIEPDTLIAVSLTVPKPYMDRCDVLHNLLAKTGTPYSLLIYVNLSKGKINGIDGFGKYEYL